MSNDLKVNTILKRLMKERGETLVSLSKTTGVPKSTISEWLSNRSPNPVQAVKVANALGVSLHYLLFGEDDAQEAFQKIMKEDFFKGTFEISIKRVKVKG
jgi:transcriptional regulator with XRE-family HTH domain